MLDTRAAMGDKPVIVCLRMHNPTVLSELEPAADAILIDFGVQKQVLLDLICRQGRTLGAASGGTARQHGNSGSPL